MNLLLPLLVLLGPFCLSAVSGSVQGTVNNYSAAHLNSSTISSSSTTACLACQDENKEWNVVFTSCGRKGIFFMIAETMTVTNATQKSVKTTAPPDITSKITTITNKITPTAQPTIATQTVKPIVPASTNHSSTESGTHKTIAVPVTKPSPALVTKVSAVQGNSLGFSAGSFIGGIVLTLGLLAFGYIGCRIYHTKRGVQYRTIDEHDAII